jgi:hypothetical protein
MRARLSIALLGALGICLALATPAMAGKGGEGTFGKASDADITNFGFGLLIFFTALVTILSIGQYLLERRKQRR